MDRTQILEAIKEEISRLERVRELLSAANGIRAINGTSATANGNGSHPVKRRVLSEEARSALRRSLMIQLATLFGFGATCTAGVVSAASK